MPNRNYQFKITLKDITPTIWRRIQIPEAYSFWDFHVAIQDAMGWLDYHLHAFRMRRNHSRAAIEIGIPDDYGFEGVPEIHAGWKIPVSDYFQDVGARADYAYDFGDGWLHEIVLEDFLPREKGKKYPWAPSLDVAHQFCLSILNARFNRCAQVIARDGMYAGFAGAKTGH